MSNDVGEEKEAIVAAHQSDKGYKGICKQFEVHYFTVKRLFTSRKHLKQLSIFPGVDVPANSPQGQTMKCSKETVSTS